MREIVALDAKIVGTSGFDKSYRYYLSTGMR